MAKTEICPETCPFGNSRGNCSLGEDAKLCRSPIEVETVCIQKARYRGCKQCSCLDCEEREIVSKIVNMAQSLVSGEGDALQEYRFRKLETLLETYFTEKRG